TGIWPFATVADADFATYDAAGGVRAFTGYVSSLAAAGPGDTVRLTGVNETVAADKTVNALLLNSTASNRVTINPAATLTLAGGGLAIRQAGGLAPSIVPGTGAGVATLDLGGDGFLFSIGFFANGVSTRVAATGGVAFSGPVGNSRLSLNPGTT